VDDIVPDTPLRLSILLLRGLAEYLYATRTGFPPAMLRIRAGNVDPESGSDSDSAYYHKAPKPSHGLLGIVTFNSPAHVSLQGIYFCFMNFLCSCCLWRASTARGFHTDECFLISYKEDFNLLSFVSHRWGCNRVLMIPL